MVKTYSGGMRRRLDLAASLMTQPPVLFLDEPTTGLDPTSRQRMWDVIRELVAGGTTLLLTTQYLDEADALADTISVIDHGRVIANGTARELKARIGGDQLEVTLTTPNADAVDALAPLVNGRVQVVDDGRRLVAPVEPGSGIATDDRAGARRRRRRRSTTSRSTTRRSTTCSSPSPVDRPRARSAKPTTAGR